MTTVTVGAAVWRGRYRTSMNANDRGSGERSKNRINSPDDNSSSNGRNSYRSAQNRGRREKMKACSRARA